MKRHANRLKAALAGSHALAARLDEPGFPLAWLEALQGWQRQRLAHTYRDLISQERFRAAGNFFLAELYGGLHFRERDQEVARVLPVMIRTLREDMLLAASEAFELQSLSLDLDLEMTHKWLQSGRRELNATVYGEVYRACGRARDRHEQIELIRHLGLQLNELVHQRMVLLLIRLLRGPARAAGFGRLQSFLEEGLGAFRAMGDGTGFILEIWNTEKEIMQRLLAGGEIPLAGDQNPFT